MLLSVLSACLWVDFKRWVRRTPRAAGRVVPNSQVVVVGKHEAGCPDLLAVGQTVPSLAVDITRLKRLFDVAVADFTQQQSSGIHIR